MRSRIWTSDLGLRASASVLAVVIWGCGATQGRGAGARAPEPVLTRSHEVASLDPMALGDSEVVTAIRHHAWLARHGRAWIEDARPFDDHAAVDLDPHELAAVIGQTQDRLRVVSQMDDANVAVWIDRDDVAPTPVATLQLADADGHADRVDGVWLAAGVDVDAEPAASGRRELSVRDELLSISGWVNERAIGDVWLGNVPAQTRPSPRAMHVETEVAIREAPNEYARVLAQTHYPVGASVLGRRGAWQEIEYERRGVRVRGFVQAAEVGADDGVGQVSSGGFSTYGMSDTESLDVAAGACLFDRPDGHVVGVNLVQRTRYATEVDEEWPSVYVDTPWGLITLSVHVGGDGVASCAAGQAER